MFLAFVGGGLGVFVCIFKYTVVPCRIPHSNGVVNRSIGAGMDLLFCVCCGRA